MPQTVSQETAKSKLTQDTQTASFYSLLAVLRSCQGKQHLLRFSYPVQGGTALRCFLSLEKEAVELPWQVEPIGEGRKSSTGALAVGGACSLLTSGISSWSRADLQHRWMVVGVQAISVSPNDHKTFSFYLILFNMKKVFRQHLMIHFPYK